MKKIVTILLTGALLFTICAAAWGAYPVSRNQYRKSKAYHKNVFPAGWRYEAGYTVWRMSRNLPANHLSYRRYKRDRMWHNRMRRYHSAEKLALDTLDWTAEELALLMREYQDYLKFHPAGYED